MNIKILKDVIIDLIALISLALVLNAGIGVVIYGCIYDLIFRKTIIMLLLIVCIGVWSLMKLRIE